MPDIVALIQSTTTPWLYLPLAVLLGALHALEPGHAKSLMAAFIIAIRGSAAQAVLLGLSAAVGHSIVVWGIALAGLYLANQFLMDHLQPYLVLLSGLLIIGLAVRLLHQLTHTHHHGHGHTHTSSCGHHHPMPTQAQAQHITTGSILWFGFTGGLMPCPSAIAVLLVCLQLKSYALGFSMVAAFSTGLALTLISVGVLTAWGTQAARKRFQRASPAWLQALPYASAILVLGMGLVITAHGLTTLGLSGVRLPSH